MKVCMVTAYPPSNGGLAEYGWYMVDKFSKNKAVEDLTVLANKPGIINSEKQSGLNLVRCWKFDDLTTPIKILKEIRKVRPDVVYFNLHMLSWGKSRLCNFLCHTTPFLVKILTRSKVVITLHNIGDSVDMKHIDFIHGSFINRLGGFIVTNLLLQADAVVVTLKSYAAILRRKYNKNNVVYIPHGSPEIDADKINPNDNILLTFGYWSNSKNLPLLLDVFTDLRKRIRYLRLVVVGDSNPKTPNYLENIKKMYSSRKIKFVGYVSENRLKRIILNSSIVVLPYMTATGSSGVLHWSIACGKPLIASDISMFKELANEERVAIQFFKSGDKKTLAQAIEKLISDKKMRLEMGRNNLITAKKFSFTNISGKYVDLFGKIAGKK